MSTSDSNNTPTAQANMAKPTAPAEIVYDLIPGVVVAFLGLLMLTRRSPRSERHN